jgi:beta-galactosidase GanA
MFRDTGAMRTLIRGILALVTATIAISSGFAKPPAIEKRGEVEQLVVDGRPYLILGGELGNSAASSRAYMQPVWPKLKQLNLNTVLAPVSWELIEPQEGRFEFSSVDDLLADARAHDMRLVILWFGAWKNSMSSYVPAWVKRDQQRFPRVRLPDGKSVEILSAFSEQSLEADSRAFAALMRHLKRVDGDRQTVLMVQVENEIGMIPAAREHGPEANEAFAAPVPEALRRALGKSQAGTWTKVFGPGSVSEEIFTAWHYGRFVEALTRAGKAEYDLPMYVNAALNRPGVLPGGYPSGGPLPHLLDVWTAAAPSIDMFSPDIYFPNFTELAAKYPRSGNPLFIPEANRPDRGDVVGNALWAFGAGRAMGYSPFAIDSISDPASHPLGQAYSALNSISSLILDAQARGTIQGFKAPIAFDGTVDPSPQRVRLGGYAFDVALVDMWTSKDQQKPENHGGMLIQLGPEEFLVVGQGVILTFAPDSPGKKIVGIESAWEGRYEQGRWVRGRLLNGDETHQGRHVRLPPGPVTMQRVRLYRYN